MAVDHLRVHEIVGPKMVWMTRLLVPHVSREFRISEEI